MGEERALTPGLRAVQLVFVAAVLALPPNGRAQTSDHRAGACRTLSTLQIAHVEILGATPIAAGQYRSPDGESYEVPAMCRVYGTARPVPASRIQFELWMPAQRWNGRYYQLGTGGFGGRVHHPSLAAEVRRGNAVVSMDTGHSGSQFDASWARGHPEKIIDYGYRSIGATSSAAHPIVRAYYGRGASKRYFVGCSNGGRQALMAAERFPEDWDGILAGSPATPWIGHFAGFAAIQQALRRDEGSWLPWTKLRAVQRAAIESCTAGARLVGGVPTEPSFCALDRRRLLCTGTETDACLTKAQVDSVDVIVRHGYDPTAATYAGGWADWIVNDSPGAKTQLTLAEEFFRNMVFEDPRWTVSRFRAGDRERAESTAVNGEALGHVLDPGADLRELRRRNGKVLMYLGSADAVLAPAAILGYHERVVGRIGDLEATREFLRLFKVPGMTHCQGGPAPNAFGQAYISPALRDDAQHDIRRALEAWVERGIAPERIVATKYVDDDPRRGVEATRTLCAYPKSADCDEKEEGQHERS